MRNCGEEHHCQRHRWRHHHRDHRVLLGGTNHATPTAHATPSVSAVAAPETAADFVKSIGATGFVAGNMKGGLGGLTGGNAYLKGKKLGINCFASDDAMKSWLKSAEQLGVAPQLESSTCVAYPSVS